MLQFENSTAPLEDWWKSEDNIYEMANIRGPLKSVDYLLKFLRAVFVCFSMHMEYSV